MDVPHQLCPLHYLREAAKPVDEVDRHAKKDLKKHLRGLRSIEQAVEQQDDAEAKAIRGYYLAERCALTDDGKPPLAASDLKLYERITTIAGSLTKLGTCNIVSASLQNGIWRPLKRSSAKKDYHHRKKGRTENST